MTSSSSVSEAISPLPQRSEDAIAEWNEGTIEARRAKTLKEAWFTRARNRPVNPVISNVTPRNLQSDATSLLDRPLTKDAVWGGLAGGVITRITNLLIDNN